MKPFRFGFQSFATTSKSDWESQVRKAEDLGFSTFTLADHYIGPGPAVEKARHPVQDVAAIPAMAMAAAASTSITIGCKVLCIDYHHPVVLAKELATIDLLSEGRLEVGLGAGWTTAEYEAMGIPMLPASKRIAKLEEVATLIRQFSAGEPLDIQGEYVTATDFAGVPVSPQPSGPKIMIGGGAPRVLGVAGRVADIVSINFNNSTGQLGGSGVTSARAEETEKKVNWVRDAAGDRFTEIEFEIPAYFTTVTEDPETVVEAMANTFGLSLDEMRQHPHALIGPVDYIIDTLEERRERYGFSYVSIASRPEEFAPVVARLAGS